MKNKIRIISDSKNSSNIFMTMDEGGHWQEVTSASDLSRRKFKTSRICDIAEDVIEVLKKTYDVSGEGLLIFFEGDREGFSCFQNKVRELGCENWKCDNVTLKFMIVGRIGSGKTSVIEGILGDKFGKYERKESDGYTLYDPGEDTNRIYEIDGIGFDPGNFERTRETIETLIDREKIDTILYCFSSKIESGEKNLLNTIKTKYPEVKILGLLTRAVDESAEMVAKQLSEDIGIQVKSVLAKEMTLRGKHAVKAYGVDEIVQFIYGDMNG